MLCEYPNCLRSVHSVCTTHCQWSLCEEHLDEHRRLMLVEYEQILQDINRPLAQLSQSIGESQKTLEEHRKKEVYQIEREHRREVSQIEQQILELQRLKEQYRERLMDFNQLKMFPEQLTQNHFQQLDSLTAQLVQQPNSSTGEAKNEPMDYEEKKTPAIDPFQFSASLFQSSPSKKFQCPLRSLNVYGLTPAHNVRLCTGDKQYRQIVEHFRHYHCLKSNYAHALMEAINLASDPMTTQVFPTDPTTSVLEDKHPCPLHDTPKSSGIRCTPCPSLILDKLVRAHLKTVHRLPWAKIKKILEVNEF